MSTTIPKFNTETILHKKVSRHHYPLSYISVVEHVAKSMITLLMLTKYLYL